MSKHKWRDVTQLPAEDSDLLAEAGLLWYRCVDADKVGAVSAVGSPVEYRKEFEVPSWYLQNHTITKHGVVSCGTDSEAFYQWYIREE